MMDRMLLVVVAAIVVLLIILAILLLPSFFKDLGRGFRAPPGCRRPSPKQA